MSILEAQGRVPDAISALKEILDSTTHKTYEQPQAAMRIELLERLAYLYRENDQWGPAVDALRQIGDLDPEAAAAPKRRLSTLTAAPRISRKPSRKPMRL